MQIKLVVGVVVVVFGTQPSQKGRGSIPDLTSQTALHTRSQRLTAMQISLCYHVWNRPTPLNSSVDR